MNTQIQWVEAWIDSASGEYILLLRGLSNGSIQIVDPQEKARIIGSFNNYEEAVHWLREDEYDLIEGRYTFD